MYNKDLIKKYMGSDQFTKWVDGMTKKTGLDLVVSSSFGPYPYGNSFKNLPEFGNIKEYNTLSINRFSNLAPTTITHDIVPGTTNIHSIKPITGKVEPLRGFDISSKAFFIPNPDNYNDNMIDNISLLISAKPIERYYEYSQTQNYLPLHQVINQDNTIAKQPLNEPFLLIPIWRNTDSLLPEQNFGMFKVNAGTNQYSKIITRENTRISALIDKVRTQPAWLAFNIMCDGGYFWINQTDVEAPYEWTTYRLYSLFRLEEFTDRDIYIQVVVSSDSVDSLRTYNPTVNFSSYESPEGAPN